MTLLDIWFGVLLTVKRFTWRMTRHAPAPGVNRYTTGRNLNLRRLCVQVRTRSKSIESSFDRIIIAVITSIMKSTKVQTL